MTIRHKMYISISRYTQTMQAGNLFW